MTDTTKLFAEYVNQLARRHKKKARRRRALTTAKQKAPATGGTGVADAPTAIPGG